MKQRGSVGMTIRPARRRQPDWCRVDGMSALAKRMRRAGHQPPNEKKRRRAGGWKGGGCGRGWLGGQRGAQ